MKKVSKKIVIRVKQEIFSARKKIILSLIGLSTGAIAIALGASLSIANAASCQPTGTTYGTDTMSIAQPSTTNQIWVRVQSPTSITPNTTQTSPLQLQVTPPTGGSAPVCFSLGGSSTIPANTWTWVHTDYANNPLTVTLPAYSASANNVTQLELIGMQPGIEVDSILMLTDGCVPSGTGTNCTTNQPLPPTPNLTGIAASPTSVKLNWTEGSYSDGTVAGFLVYRGTTQIAKITNASTTTYTDTVTSGSTNSYTVVAYDSSSPTPFNSLPSQAVVITTGLTAPTNVTATASSPTQVNLTWNASSDAGGTGLAGYTIERTGGGIVVDVATVAPTATSYQDLTVTPKASYSYRVIAIDNNTPPDQAASNSVGVQTPALPGAPQAPTNAKATVNAYNSVSLSWTASVDTNGTVGGYYVLRTNPTGGVTTIATVKSPTVTYTDTTVTPSTTYTYTIEAFDSVYATVVSPAASTTPSSVTTPAAPDTQPPTAPTLTKGSVTSSQINLAWSGSTDNIGVVKYQIYKNSNLLASVSGSTTTYGDTGLSPSTTYSYYVVAYDAANNHSPQSNTLSVTTSAPSTKAEVKGYVTSSATKAAIVGALVHTGIHGTTSGAATSTTNSNGYYDLINITPNRKHIFDYSATGFRGIGFSRSFPIGQTQVNEALVARK